MDYIALFARSSPTDHSRLLSSALAGTNQSVVRELQAWEPNDLLSTPIDTVIERLINKATVRCPRLLAEEAEMLEPTETIMEFMEFGEQQRRRVTRMTLAVPYDGEQEVFTLRADTSSNNPPRVLRMTDKELHLGVDDPPNDGAQLRAAFDAQIAKIEQYLGWSRQQIDRHNDQLQAEVPKMVAARRDELLAARNLQAETGYRTRSRPSTDSR